MACSNKRSTECRQSNATPSKYYLLNSNQSLFDTKTSACVPCVPVLTVFANRTSPERSHADILTLWIRQWWKRWLICQCWQRWSARTPMDSANQSRRPSVCCSHFGVRWAPSPAHTICTYRYPHTQTLRGTWHTTNSIGPGDSARDPRDTVRYRLILAASHCSPIGSFRCIAPSCFVCMERPLSVR